MILATTLMTGCGGDGVADSYRERMQRIKQIDDVQARMFVDDWDYLWLYERGSYLSEWYPRVGN